MLTRRNIVGSVTGAGALALVASGWLTNAQHPPTNDTIQPAPPETPVPSSLVASGLQAIAGVGYMLATIGGALATKNYPVMLEALEKGAEGVRGLIGLGPGRASAPPSPDAARIKTQVQIGDILMRLEKIDQDLRSAIRFREQPVLPGRSEPEKVYVFQPLIWSDAGLIRGERYNIEADRIVGEHTLYGPDYAPTGIQRSGVYRVGYELSALDEGPMLYGGGPFVHIFADQVWDYERILAEYGQEAPPEIDATLYEVDPFHDADLLKRSTVNETE